MFINKTSAILDLNKFNEEVKVAESKIEVVMLFGSDDLRFTLSEALTTQEDTDLDTFITNFVDSDPDLKIPKIYDLVTGDLKSSHFHNILYTSPNVYLRTDSTTGATLIPKRTVSQGEVTQVDWYKELDESMTPVDLVLRVEINYTRDTTGFATSRTTIRTWINRDGTDNPDKKITAKYYFVNPSDMITEGYKRRKLLVQSIQIPAMTFMMEVLMPLGYTQEAVVLLGRAFMDDYESDFSKFVENSSTITDPADPNVGKKTIVVELEDVAIDGRNADYNLWLDKAPASIGGQTTIRQYLITEFSI